MYWPSGDHAGLFTSRLDSVDTSCRAVPSGSMVQMFQFPARSLMNATREPSGLNRGCMSNDEPATMRVAVPPSMGIV